MLCRTNFTCVVIWSFFSNVVFGIWCLMFLVIEVPHIGYGESLFSFLFLFALFDILIIFLLMGISLYWRYIRYKMKEHKKYHTNHFLYSTYIIYTFYIMYILQKIYMYVYIFMYLFIGKDFWTKVYKRTRLEHQLFAFFTSLMNCKKYFLAPTNMKNLFG